MRPRKTYLDRISTEIPELPLAMILYGPPGVGKTSVAARFPKALVITDDQELGIHDLKRAKELPASIPVSPLIGSWDMLLGICSELEGEHNYDYAVFDCLSGIERLGHEKVCEVEYDKKWTGKGFYSYMQGYDVFKTHHNYLPEFIRALGRIRENGTGIILVGHSEEKRYSPPEMADYDRYIVSVHRKTWQPLHRWAEVIIFMNYHIELTSKGIKEKVAQPGVAPPRWFNTVQTSDYDAKNRRGMSASIPCGNSAEEAYENLAKELGLERRKRDGGKVPTHKKVVRRRSTKSKRLR